MAPPESLAALCSAKDADRAAHTYGKGYRDLVRGFHGDFSPAPDFVAYPRAEDEVRAVLEWCGDNRVALIPFGGGTSVVRGVEAAVGKAIAAPCRSTCAASIASSRSTRSRARRASRRARPAPRSRRSSRRTASRCATSRSPSSSRTLGGWIATRAGGHFATLYTHIDDLVRVGAHDHARAA